MLGCSTPPANRAGAAENNAGVDTSRPVTQAKDTGDRSYVSVRRWAASTRTIGRRYEQLDGGTA